MSDESDRAFAELRRQLSQLRVATAVLGVALLAAVVWLTARPPSIPAVLTVERL
jgi:hypothetical protein